MTAFPVQAPPSLSVIAAIPPQIEVNSPCSRLSKLIEKGVGKVRLVAGSVRPVQGLTVVPIRHVVGPVPNPKVDIRVGVLRKIGVPQSKHDKHVRRRRVDLSGARENQLDFHDVVGGSVDGSAELGE